ncbi:MAG: hypothetical protein K5776_04625 [Lachnospiraceae bacterium]|nr:hypothetical protein [Lachnospiraceae bacterium]
MGNLAELRLEDEDFVVEYSVEPIERDLKKVSKYSSDIDDITALMEENQQKIDKLNREIDLLTNHADGLDYAVAVGSGVIAGAIDIFFVGEFSFEVANQWGNKTADKIVEATAKMQGYKGKDTAGAIKFLEEKFPIAADKNTAGFGGGLQHHLRDFSHHPTIVGLFFSMLTQFTGNVYGTDTAGFFKWEPVNDVEKLLIGKDLPHKILFGVIWWFFHMISDMAGSSSSRTMGKMGTGLPGPIVSLLKEVSALPIFQKTNENGFKEFSVWISKLFNGTLLGDAKNPIKFDLRTEIGTLMQLGKQAIPVIINECVVRGFYFIRRLVNEIKEKKPKTFGEFKELDWRKIAPAKNRTVVRMLTISTGTMEAIDLAHAAIESAVKSAGAVETGPGAAAVFATNMMLNVNFVGLGRFVIACGTDVGMGIRRSQKRNERMQLNSNQLKLMNVIVLYKEAEMWEAAEDTGEAILDAWRYAEKAAKDYIDYCSEMSDSVKSMRESIALIDKKNPRLRKKLSDTMKWG